MIEKLNELAGKFSERTAFVFGNKKVSYNELFDRAEKIAERFEENDSSPAVVFGGRDDETFSAIIACLIAKRAYVPVDVSMPEERRNRIIGSSGAGIIIDCSEKKAEIKKTETRAQTVDKRETAYIIFTSGSTGEPKGVPISYANLDNFIEWITRQNPLCDFEHVSVFNQAAFSFDLSTAAIYYALFGGHAIVQLEDKNDFEGIFETIKQNKTEVFVITPTFMRLCLLNGDFSARNFPFLKCVYFCGETLQKSLCKEIFKRFPDVRIINAYGPTEATSAVCASEITKEILEHEDMLPCGKITSAATEIDIENGEIVLKGKNVFGGYLDNIKGGYFKEGKTDCYRTGDTGFIHGGKLYCTGRIDGQIKYKGYRIELSDIESNLSDIEGIENCAVVAKRNPEGEVRLIKAFVCGNIPEDEIRCRLAKKLPDYMIPKTIKIIEKMPVNQNGKINRKELEKI